MWTMNTKKNALDDLLWLWNPIEILRTLVKYRDPTSEGPKVQDKSQILL